MRRPVQCLARIREINEHIREVEPEEYDAARDRAAGDITCPRHRVPPGIPCPGGSACESRMAVYAREILLGRAS